MNISLIVIASKTGVSDDLLIWINADVALAVADSLKTLSQFVQLTSNNTLRPLCSVIDGKDGKIHKKENAGAASFLPSQHFQDNVRKQFRKLL